MSVPREQIGRISELPDPLSAVVVITEDQLTQQECHEIARLVHRGIRMFAFVGPLAEQSHDCFDEVLQQTSEDVSMTTYHVDESNEDIAAMLLAYLRDKNPRRILLVNGALESTARLVSAFESITQE